VSFHIPEKELTMARTILDIGGMTCGGCVASVTRVLSGLPGVASAEVSLATAQAVVEHDPLTAPVPALRAAVEDAGFSVR
jgi:copper chaperone